MVYLTIYFLFKQLLLPVLLPVLIIAAPILLVYEWNKSA